MNFYIDDSIIIDDDEDDDKYQEYVKVCGEKVFE